jgi:hypothetical protein
MITITLNEVEMTLFAKCDQCPWNIVLDSEMPGAQISLFEHVNGHKCEPLPKELTLNAWVKEIGEWAESKGWNEKDRDASEWIALAHTELSEAYEAYRETGDMRKIWYSGESSKPEGYLTELADTFIRLCHNVSLLGVDFNALVAEKMAYNQDRPYRHGGKYA